MERVTLSSSVSAPRGASHHDELFMQQSLLFLDSLKELKNVRKQLYSAAECFEVSYGKEDQKQLAMEAMKDYTIKAFINTVDHLGTMAFKFNSLLDEKSGVVSETNLRFSCIQQKLQAHQELIDRGGIFQQSLAQKFPRRHKRYIFPVGGTADAVNQSKTKNRTEEKSYQFKNADKAITREIPSLLDRRVNAARHSPRSSSGPGAFNFAKSNRVPEKRATSPQRFSLLRSGSLLKRSISPNSSNAMRRYPSEPRRPVSLSTYAERDKTEDIEQYSSKSKHLFKAFGSMGKFRKDGALYKYLDEK